MSEIVLTRQQRRLMQKLADRVDKVTRADRRFFERFPHRQHRVRLAAQCELAQQAILEGKPPFCPRGCQIFCIARNIASGIRLRLFVVSVADADTDVSEEVARTIFESAATPRTWAIEAQFRRAAEARA